MIVFEQLDKNKHSRDFFDCGNDELNNFIKTLANQQQKRGFSVVYVAVENDSILPKKIYGYYTLSANTLSFENLPKALGKKMPSSYPIPTLKIGRLAKDTSVAPGFGGDILAHALKQVLEISKTIGVCGVDVDAKNEKAKSFYQKYGFIALKDEMALFMPIKTLNDCF